jgi:hypothetical protein
VIGAIGVVAWIAIGMPMTIADLKTDIENIKNEIAAPGSVPPAAAATAPDASDPNATDTSGGGADDTTTTTTAPPTSPVPQLPSAADQQQQPSPPQFLDLSSLVPSQQQDDGTTNGTAAPTPPIAPVSVAHPILDVPAHQAPPVGLTPQQEATTPPHSHHFKHTRHGKVLHPGQGLKLAKHVVHHPPHAVAKTLPHHGKGTPGWYTIPGHHHCIEGTPNCYCTDKSKCHVTVVANKHHPKHKQQHHKTSHSHLAYTGQFHYAEDTPISTFHWDY